MIVYGLGDAWECTALVLQCYKEKMGIINGLKQPVQRY